jgi:hypothetical protein
MLPLIENPKQSAAAAAATVVTKLKHPNKVVIEYYDDLINDVDIYAEECLKEIGEKADTTYLDTAIITMLKVTSMV